jgi:F-type H+-transporting ATPase subunit epsilon
MITVEIVTPERLVHTIKGMEAMLPTVDGQIGIRRGHLPLIAPLKAGEIIVKQEDGTQEFYAISGGFAEILGNTVHILADTAERAEELNEERVTTAIERAQKLKSESPVTTESYADAAAQLEANLARLKTIQRKKAHHHRRTE